ncbi:MAG: CDP-alcohol phosphatidyltransferase family protein [Saprospirales bacterium]|nr:CDP-alcohol phosphatidyltransferase family protein [Saprospirales bacterium]
MQNRSYSFSRQLSAWGVHIFTSCGMLTGFLAIVAISNGHFREATLWLVASQLIDGFDGTLARWVNVEKVLPHMSGKTIDMVIDFANYALIPAYFLYESGLLAAPYHGLAAGLILLVSALYYGKDGMVSEDYHFVGFPVMWNLVVFFLYFVLHLSPTANFLLVVFFAILHFVPIKFAYPSRAGQLRWPTLPLGVIWICLAAAILWIYPETSSWLNGAVLLVLGYFGVLAVKDTFGN